MNNTPKRKSWSISKETKEKIKQLRKEKMKVWDIAQYMNLPLTTIHNIIYNEVKAAARKRYYEKNREKVIKYMVEYQKEYRAKKKIQHGIQNNRPNDFGGISRI